MSRLPTLSTRTYTLFPYTTLFRSFDNLVPLVPVRYLPREQSDALVLALDQAFIQLLRRDPLVISVSISAVRLDRKGCINDHRPWRSIDHEIQGSLTLCRRVVGLHYRLEESRVGKGCVSTCRSRVWPDH